MAAARRDPRACLSRPRRAHLLVGGRSALATQRQAADAGAVEDRTVGAVVGTPTFRSAFDGLLEKGYTPSQIREAVLSQSVELVRRGRCGDGGGASSPMSTASAATVPSLANEDMHILLQMAASKDVLRLKDQQLTRWTFLKPTK